MMETQTSSIIVYGSYGYTGRLITEECRTRGLHVILAGRNGQQLKIQSLETGYPFEVVGLDDTIGLEKLLARGRVVIHCAGPFQNTASPMADICIATRTHYTDISGEYQVFEMLARRDGEAKRAGIMILPGTGFDVVPTDCLAAHLAGAVPDATRLELALISGHGGVSRGTARTMVLALGQGSIIRERGRLVQVPFGTLSKDLRLGRRVIHCINIPWGDVSTAWHSTKIPNISVYLATGRTTAAAARILRVLNPLLKAEWVTNVLLRQIDKRITGPDVHKLNSTTSVVWGAVYNEHGSGKSAMIKCPNGYKLTAMASTLIAEKILAGSFKTGYQTPATAYGSNLILEIPNTVRQES